MKRSVYFIGRRRKLYRTQPEDCAQAPTTIESVETRGPFFDQSSVFFRLVHAANMLCECLAQRRLAVLWEHESASGAAFFTQHSRQIRRDFLSPHRRKICLLAGCDTMHAVG